MQNTPVQAGNPVRSAVHEVRPLLGERADYDELLDAVGDASVVLIGEASHGTHEFYRERMRITARLIEDAGFSAVAIEGDWPDAYRLDRYVRGESRDSSAREALAGFARFPTWMWRNADVLRSLDWLRAWNDAQRFDEHKVGFYGLDLYSMRASMEAVVEYLESHDVAAAAEARLRYACFDHVGIASPESLGQEYGYAVTRGAMDPCEDEVVAELIALHQQRAELVSRDGLAASEAYFAALRNAELVHNAEVYYREMYHGRASSWNLRDSHMTQTLAAIREHLAARGAADKVVVWAHNSHVGDARVTELARPDRPGGPAQHNVGQLARERWPGQTFIVGQTTSHGTVTATTDWGAQTMRRQVRPARENSFENVFHTWGLPAFVGLTGRGAMVPPAHAGSGRPRPVHEQDVLLERAIGVIYRPQTERASHWFQAALQQQFDAVVHVDATTALEPIDREPRWDRGEPPETYPTGL